MGVPDLGSKYRPLRFYFTKQPARNDDVMFIKKLESCVESQGHMRIIFQPLATERAVVSSLVQGDGHFGLISSFQYVESTNSYLFKGLWVLSEKQKTSNRALIISLKPNFNSLQNARFAYLIPDSDVGFLVPRHMMMMGHMFPQEAFFAGTYQEINTSLTTGLAEAGVFSESYARSQWPQVPLHIGQQLGSFFILDISKSLPTHVVITAHKIPPRLTESVFKVLDLCGTTLFPTEFQNIFQGDRFLPIEENLFDFIHELWEFQKIYPRVSL